MLRQAQAEFPRLLIDEREVRRDGPSYMVDTLREIRAEHPGRPLLLLVGQDAMNYLHRWHRWRQLFTLAHIVTFPRPDARADYVPELEDEVARRRHLTPETLLETGAGGFLHLGLDLIDISATGIQEIIRRGDSPRSMLPDSVLEYIGKNALYEAG